MLTTGLLLLTSCQTADTADSDKETGTATTDTADSDTSDTADTAVEVILDGECPQETRWGTFQIDSNDDYGYVTGYVSNGVVPMSILTVGLVSGDCTVFKKENPYCEDGCDPGYTCDFDGTCVVYPEAQDLGTVTVDGLLQAVSMEPVTPGYNYFDTSVPNPPWEPGATITLNTSGGAYDPVSLQALGLDTFAVADLEWAVGEGLDLELTWEAPVIEIRSEVELTLNIDQHGITPSTAVCVFEDDGTGTVPADVIDNLFALGVSGFPSGTLIRRTIDSAPIGDGCMELTTTASHIASIDVAGYTPCTDDEDCPEGQECNTAIELCE